MKRLLFLLSFFYIGQSKGSAQTNVYHPFPKDTATWFHNWIPQGCTGNCPYYRTMQMGDTLINTISYKKLYKQQGTFFPSCGGGNPCFTPSGAFTYQGALRQDSGMKKVYFFPSAGLTHDTLLYDYNLTIGDTLALSYLNCCGSGWQWTVKKIDSILISGRFHKTFIFDTIYGQSSISFLIEGVGNSFGPLMRFDNCINDCWGLGCFNENSIPNTACNSAYCPLHVLSLNQIILNTEFCIYPNPTSNQFYIETNTTDKLTVDLYDVNGRHVYSASAMDKSNINVATLDEGIYTMTIKSVDYVTNKKLVIVR
ncbi:MAG TPA: T9SS type A sorting domain-containing protein [Bacteroidia bacterium]|jgi:hypothetical protein|nr:T9SS type A sorting domain-containing protein [Bacteroidia bacterium]